MDVQLVNPGGTIKDILPNNKKGEKKKAPEDFFEKHEISVREDKGLVQYEAAEINEALVNYKTKGTFCTLALTNHDLWKGDWAFIVGQANAEAETGVFSFHRLDANFDDGIDWKCPPELERTFWLNRACRVMVHEISHMFGLKHCFYYECTMNGANGPFEGIKVRNRTLCPVCLCKLQVNAKFDAKARYEKLLEVCGKLGFEEEAQSYAQILQGFKSA